MRNKIIIATKNLDKFTYAVDVFIALGLRDYQFLNLKDLHFTSIIKEEGTVVDRARQKAQFYLEHVPASELKEVRTVIGIDDGIFIKKEGYSTADSKPVVDQILENNRLGDGDEVDIIRGYYFYIFPLAQEVICQTVIPCKYFGHEHNLTRVEGRYPLAQVFGYYDANVPISKNTPAEILANNLRYEGKELEIPVGIILQHT